MIFLALHAYLLLSITFDSKFVVLYIFISFIKKIIIIIIKTAKKCCKINGGKNASSDTTAGLLSLGNIGRNNSFLQQFQPVGTGWKILLVLSNRKWVNRQCARIAFSILSSSYV